MSDNLQQTRGSFKLYGIVKGIGKENALRKGETKKEPAKPWKSLRFGIQTSPTNTVWVELFGMEKKEVHAYSSKAKNSVKAPWGKRYSKDAFPQGYKLMGTSCSLEADPKKEGQFVRKILAELDAVDYIYKFLNDGDSVFVNGTIEYSEYEGNTQTRYSIQSIGKLKQDVDFSAEDFKEVAMFEQEIVFTEIQENPDDDSKFQVLSKVIVYGGDFFDASFTIDKARNPKLANSFQNKLSWGDLIKVYGLVVNGYVVEENAKDDDEDDDWGNEKPEGMNGGVRDFIQFLQITGVHADTLQKERYTEEDFVKSDADETYGEDEFTDDQIDISEDDLPF